jgi:hypothetical protein
MLTPNMELELGNDSSSIVETEQSLRYNDKTANNDDQPSFNDSSSSTDKELNDNENVDPVEEIVRTKADSNALFCSSMAVALLIVVDSIISIARYEVQENYFHETQMIDYNIPVYPAQSGVCAAELGSSDNTSPPLWGSMLVFQIGLYQNLMHASFFAGAILLVVNRGDVIWLFATRNFVFFMPPMAALTFLADIYTIITSPNSFVMSHNQFNIIMRLIVVFGFAATGSISFYFLDRICRCIRRFVTESIAPTPTIAQQACQMDETCLQEKISSSKHSMLTSNDIRTSRIIHFGTIATQAWSLLFLFATTVEWIQLQSDCSDEMDRFSSIVLGLNTTMSIDMSMNSTSHISDGMDGMHRRLEGVQESIRSTDEPQSPMTGDLNAFTMSYTIFAHQSFLLAMMQMAVIYPTCRNSLGVCILSALWRFLVGVFNLIYLSHEWTGIDYDQRQLFSLVFTSLEMVTMIPILYASISAFLERFWCHKRTIGGVMLTQSSYTQIESTNLDANVVDGIILTERDTADDEGDVSTSHLTPASASTCQSFEESVANSVSTFSFVTLRSIASSECYDGQQRLGARVLYIGSLVLLAELTLECIVLLRQNFIGTNVTFDVYKWGMHVIGIYISCSSMFTETPFIYKHARQVLIFACPLGSAIAMWQLSLLLRSGEALSDDWTNVIALLFFARFLSGITQIIGLLALRHTEQRTTLGKPNHREKDSQALELALQRGRDALSKVYIPIFVIYVAFVTIVGNCSEPMISPMIPLNADDDVCMVTSMDLMLAQNWPGMGLFFHFGMVLVVFSAVGLDRSAPSYKPALLIAASFAGMVVLLLFVHLFCWDLAQTNGWDMLSTVEISRRVLMMLWMISSGYLSFCLNRLWNLRVLPGN